MQYVDVQGARIPALGLGTWQLTGPHCRDVVQQALQMGYRHIDTAQSYANEGDVGAGIRLSGIERDDVWLTTKVSLEHMRHDDVIRSTRDSLRRLAVDYVDLLLIHWPSREIPLEQTLSALFELQNEGVAHHIGVSNFTSSMVEAALGVAPLLAIQVECHPFLPQHELVSFASDRDLLLTAYSPLARGEVTRDPVLRSIGARHEKGPGQVALRWLLQRPNIAAIPKASSLEHLRENLDVFDFELDETELVRIEELGRVPRRLLDPPYAPVWESPVSASSTNDRRTGGAAEAS